ncbi:MAG: class I SAM-dependent methyltransferase [Sumerlaeia bacterium]
MSSIIHHIKKFLHLIEAELALMGKGPYHCTVCGRNVSKFLAFNGRKNALCPNCKSLERHRALILHLNKLSRDLALSSFDIETGETKACSVLHFAPEQGLSQHKVFRNFQYFSSDPSPKMGAMFQWFLGDDPLTEVPDNRFQLIICSHVLEHVEKDSEAMKTLYRILAPGGYLLVMVPLSRSSDEIFEDPNVKTPEDRLRVYGQDDHVRLYSKKGMKERLSAAGFDVSMIEPNNEKDHKKFGLHSWDFIFQANKPKA